MSEPETEEAAVVSATAEPDWVWVDAAVVEEQPVANRARDNIIAADMITVNIFFKDETSFLKYNEWLFDRNGASPSGYKTIIIPQTQKYLKKHNKQQL